MKSFLTILALGVLALMPAAFAEDMKAMGNEAEAKNAKIVVFYSDTCGSCKIMEPKFMEAMQAINKDKLDMVKLDFSNAETIKASKAMAMEKNVNDTLQTYGAKTGFAVLLNAEGEEVGKITKDLSPEEMATKLVQTILAS